MFLGNLFDSQCPPLNKVQLSTRSETGYLVICQVLGFGLNLEKHFLTLVPNYICKIEN